MTNPSLNRLPGFRLMLYSAAMVASLLFLFICPARADEPSNEPATTVRYNRDVLPILAENCLACHGFDKGQRQAGLRLDRLDAATAELESGTRAIVPHDVAKSTLIERITATAEDQRMPPKESGKTLTPAQQDTLRRWVEQGANYEPHWAFITPRSVEPPAVEGAAVEGAEHAIDRFVRARLNQAAIAPSPEADRAILIRRLSLDLTGLPPSPLEVDAFENDARHDAYERVVDRLLASEHFGERWGRWWLDLAHYADSDGYLQDFIRPVAWRYRQWVVDALNRDLPFDQFTIEQLAGDLLPDATVQQRIATGFLRNTLSNREGGADLEEYRVRQVIDRAATTGTTWLALTMGCAECHDHKFDPISQVEFYQFYAFFNNADEVNFNAPLSEERDAWQTAKIEYDRKRSELLAPAAAAIAELQTDWEQRLLHAEAHPGADFTWDRALEVLGLVWGQGLGEGQLEGVNIIKTPLDQRTQEQKDRLLDYFLANAPADYATKFAELKLNELRGQLDALTKSLPLVTRAPGMAQTMAPRLTHLHLRGDFRRRGDPVQAATPALLPPLIADGQPDRLALARWLVAPGHPLTSRVTVNRLWQELFGRGLVATSENFGVRGERPSHPELLDWLALEFEQRQWSIKSLLRVIVTSHTYRQSSQSRPELALLDPNNTLLARQSRLRLSADGVRDASLAVSGLLSRTIGGPSVKPPQPASVSTEGFDNKWEASHGVDRYRRGLYTFIQRTSPFAQFVNFDLPDTSRGCTRRERSNTPLQALNLLNDPTFVEAAQSFARRVLREAPGSAEQQLEHAYRLALARAPTAQESQRMLDYLAQQQQLFSNDLAAARALTGNDDDGVSEERAAWVAVCSVLLNLDEFITRE